MTSDSSQTTLLLVAAFLVDALSVSILLILPAAVISYSLAVWMGDSSKAISLVWFIALGIVFVAMLIRDGYRGRSIGKQLLGLRVLTPTGEGCGWTRSIIRNALLILFPIELVLVLRGKPRIGDRVARTTITEE